MHYKRFIIKNYRAIVGPLEIDLANSHLTPIIGVNESGKTTILHAIYAFDSFNDKLNDGRHLQDTSNLYRSSSPPATIEAVVEMTKAELDDAISRCEEGNEPLRPHLTELKKSRKLPLTVTIRRDLKTLKYSLDSDRFGPPQLQHALAIQITLGLPYILFFDDFRDGRSGPRAGQPYFFGRIQANGFQVDPVLSAQG